MTIREIAQLAGVSNAAVSRYLNGGYVSGEKKERIKKVIQETGYHPSMQAGRSGLRRPVSWAWWFRRSIPNPSAGLQKA